MADVTIVKLEEVPAEVVELYNSVVENNGFHDDHQQGALRNAPKYGHFTNQYGKHFLVPVFEQCCLNKIVSCEGKPHLSRMSVGGLYCFGVYSGFGELRIIEK